MTMNNFDTMLVNTLKFEGGYTVDHRGETNRGITQPTYDSYTKQKGIPTKNVKDLTYGEGYSFYEDEFYKKPKIDKLPYNVGGVVFDFGVNAGPVTAIKSLQRIVGTKDDGIIGDKTITAVHKYIDKNGENELINTLVSDRQIYNNNLILKDPSVYGDYERGWRDRLIKVLELYSGGGVTAKKQEDE